MCVYRTWNCVCVLGLATQSKVSENAIKNDVQHFKTMSLVCPCRKMYEPWATCSCVPHYYLLYLPLLPPKREGAWGLALDIESTCGTWYCDSVCVCVCWVFLLILSIVYDRSTIDT